jgi:ubiquinone/menaquinone biosynthesis C-methylase UbiE
LASTFDLTAPSFDRHRAFPAGVAEAIRKTIWNRLPKPPQRILDLGAGTGRISTAFIQAGDFYVGVDLSLAMLREFAALSSSANLIQADGRQLPFADYAFDLVLLMHVLSGAENWLGLVQEALRVATSKGSVVVGQTMTPALGVDARLKERLSMILEQMHIVVHESKKSHEPAFAWLGARAARHIHLIAAQWKAERTPRQFIERRRTGARFAALPATVQNEALEKLAEWAKTTFDALDKKFIEEHSFELDIFSI